MAHFALLNEDNVVLSVIAIDNLFTIGADASEDEARGIEYLRKHVSEGRWVQTSYNHKIRRRYAGVGMTYLPDEDVFIASQPYPSWTLDLNDPSDWVPPVPMPTDEGYWYEWDEQGQAWIPHKIEEPSEPPAG